MGKQAFVKAYVCFQTTASPRPFDYEYKNIRLLPLHNCKWADKILDRHLIVQNIIHFGHLLYHRNFSLQTRVALNSKENTIILLRALKKKHTVSVEKRVPKR